MNCFDVLNKVSIRSVITQISQSEQDVARTWVEQLPKDSLTLYDRGFAGFALFFLHIHGYERQRYFVVRCKSDFNNEVKAFLAKNKKSEVVELKATKSASETLLKMGYKTTPDTKVRVRLVRVRLSSGEIEVLITNLIDHKQYPSNIFKSLYAKRWGIEVEFGAWKNIYQLEQCSGHSVTAIKQEFYATVLIANIHSLMINQASQNIKKREPDKKSKYSYKVNRNVTFGLLKANIQGIFLSENEMSVIQNLTCLFCNYKEPVRRNRKSPRIRKTGRSKGKYVTVSNYKRAA